jgi:ferric-dicitrate binding protein FerR (iron transport regulator)
MEEERFDELRQLMVENGIGGDELEQRYRHFAEIDDERSLATLRRRIAEEAETEKRGMQATDRWRWWYSYAAAAVLAILLTGGAMWYWRHSEPAVPHVPLAVKTAMTHSREANRQEAEVTPVAESPQERQTVVSAIRQRYHIDNQEAVEQLLEARRITTRQDKEYWLTLDDGTLVHLNSDTRMIYPEQFFGEVRNVVLDGEAYFMVASDASRPFIVHTPEGDVKVHGTEFNVNTRKEGATEVVLVKGSIGIVPFSGSEQMMHPGQMGSISHGTLTLEDVDVEPYTAWNTGNFMFEDCPLAKLMDVLSRWYAINVNFGDEAARNILFTGILSRYADINATLKAISTAADVEISNEGEQITINTL